MPRLSVALHRAFTAICQTYFPRWRAASTWTVRLGPRASWTNTHGQVCTSGELGYCDRAARTIWITPPVTHRVLIHESCHAVTSGKHNARFCARLRTAAQQAQALGETALATALLEEADGYAAGTPVRASDIYAQVEEMIMWSEEQIPSFEAVCDQLCWDYGQAPADLHAWCPRLQAVYARVRRQEAQQVRQMLRRLQQEAQVDGTRFAASIVRYTARLQGLETSPW
jgi:hypothetical protein